jgi:hypothetical protein
LDGEEDDDEVENDLETQTDNGSNIYKDVMKHARFASNFICLSSFFKKKINCFTNFSRKTRSVTQQGVPILEEPYLPRRNHTKSMNKIDANRDKNPKLKLTWNGQSRNANGVHRR